MTKRIPTGRRMALWIGSLLIAGGVGLFSVMISYKSVFPKLHEWPVFFSPIITAVVATMTFFEHGLDDDLKGSNAFWIRLACFVAALGTLVLCFFLCSFKTWEQHLALLGARFFLFLVWDGVMLGTLEENADKEAIRSTNRAVNIPTLLAFLLIFVFLQCVTLDSLGYDETKTGYRSAKDAFVAGLISFHLIVSALGYLLATKGTPGINSNQKLSSNLREHQHPSS